MWQGTSSYWKRSMALRNTVVMKGCTFPTIMIHVKVTFTWMPGSKVSQQSIAQSITLPPLTRLLPTGGTWHDVKENVIHQTRRPSIAPWFSSNAHMSIVVAFSSGQGSVWELWSVAMQHHTQQIVMHSVFWYISIIDRINFCATWELEWVIWPDGLVFT